MPQIDSLVRDLVWQRLTDATVGFNAQVEAMGGVTDPNTGDNPYGSVDLSIIKNDGWQLGTTCAFGKLRTNDVEGSTAMEYPFTRIVTARQPGPRYVVSAIFSGRIMFAIKHDISWIDSDATPNFEAYENIVSEAFQQCFNDPNNQIFASGITYNGDGTVQPPGDITQEGENWRQSIVFTGSFTVIQ